MLFNSLTFLLFITLFFFFWPVIKPQKNLRYIFLIIASFVFYGWFDWRYLFILVITSLNVFFAGLGIAYLIRYKRLIFISSILGTVGILIFFKYTNFFISNVNWILGTIGVSYSFCKVNISLPLGISFYTFMAMTYSIDVYQGKLKPTKNILHFFAYLSMFPQILAGPIARARNLLPQLEKKVTLTEQHRWEGLRFIVHGYFKKCVIADNLTWVINNSFSAVSPVESSIYWWIIMLMFSVQIYCDFSGYSDIAIGLAKLMGYELPTNFNHPYISSSFREFWTRWHISLSTWFRDYVYFPLGGSRKGRISSHINMWITNIISGIWHGASWTFVIWAILHSAYISIERFTNWSERIILFRGGRLFATLIVFIFVSIAWLFFRANSFEQAISILSIMFNFSSELNVNSVISSIGLQALIFSSIILIRESYFWLRLDVIGWEKLKVYQLLQPIILSVIIISCILFRGPGNTFIYFQF